MVKRGEKIISSEHSIRKVSYPGVLDYHSQRKCLNVEDSRYTMLYFSKTHSLTTILDLRKYY